MALKTKAAIKTQLDAVASALTLALADTVSGIAAEVKDPHTPLRDINKFLDISDAGVVTINAAKYDACWNTGGTVYTAPTQAIGSGTIKRKVIP